MINMLDQLPSGILDVEANQLYEYVDNHTLVHIKGADKQPLFISILQHGDETTGWDAIKLVLKAHQHELSRSIYLFFGNVQAAAKNLRQLKDQPDFNRCWPGLHQDQSEIAKKMTFLTDMMAKIKPFASIDIHNNSGRNPHYAGINSMHPAFIHLASLFSETIIHFTSPDGIQSGAFAPFCPAVTIECGMSGTADGIEQTCKFIEQLIVLPALYSQPGKVEQHQVLNIFSTVKIKSDINFGIEGDPYDQVDFVINDDLDYLNFQHIEKGTIFGRAVTADTPMPFTVIDQIGNDITDLYFEQNGCNIQTKQQVVPAMITQSIDAIRLDCLCYFMHPLSQEQ